MSEQVMQAPLSAEEAKEQYPGSSEFVHLHNHTLFSILDGVARPDEYFKGCVDRKWPAFAITEHGVLNSIPDAYLAAKEHSIKYIVGCFLPWQNVFGSQVKQINQIKSGDFVLSKDNRWQSVVNVQTRNYHGNVRRIKAWCVEDVICTPEHPLLVREVTRSEVSKGVWKENITIDYRKASELFREKYWRTYATKRSQDRNDKRRYRFYLCVPRLKPGTLTSIDCGALIKHDNQRNTLNIINNHIESITYESDGYKTTKEVNLPLDCELLWIMGLWLAEGTVSNGGLGFALCSDEMSFVERIKTYFSQFDITVSHYLREDRNVIDVNVCSRWFGRVFERLLGNFDGKRIDDQLMFGLEYDQTESLLEGLFDGDAKRTEYGSYLKLTNKTLIWQARLLMTRLGQYSAISEIQNNNSDNMSYCIRYRESGHDLDEDYIYLPIYKVEDEQYNGLVYNLETEKDHTYNVGVTVHNCEVYYNDYELTRQRLLGSGEKMSNIRVDNEDFALRMTRNRHLTVLCQNMTGYENLLKINKMAWEKGVYYGRARTWFDQLAKHKEGLIVLSGCLNGPVCHELRAGNLRSSDYITGAIDYVNKFHSVFGENYYIELQMPGIEGDVKVFRQLVAVAESKKIKVVLTNDCHYIDRRDFELQKTMMAISQGTSVNDPNLFHVNSDEQFFKTRYEMRATFARNGYEKYVSRGVFEEACDNTLEIADKCTSFNPNMSPKLPNLKDANKELCRLALQGLREKGLEKDTRRYFMDGSEVTYREQMEIELKRFIEKGFASYFLITRDLVQESYRHKWPLGPARGSAGGSLVCYLLDIQTLDPLKWGTSFDRFLSPARGGYMLSVSMD